MNKSDKTSDAKGSAKNTQATKGKRDINNNTAFYRRIKSEYDIKKWQKYLKYFSLPPYLYPPNHTKEVDLRSLTANKDCSKTKKVPKGSNVATIKAKQLVTSSKKISKTIICG